jgi:exopolysaccharide biosynthesis polyprenyl glycosylphosphotransferase
MNKKDCTADQNLFEIPVRSRRKLVDVIEMLLFLGDIVGIWCGLSIGFWVRFHSGLRIFQDYIGKSSFEKIVPNYSDYFGLMIIGEIMLILLMVYLDVYRQNNILRFNVVVVRVFKAVMIWVCLFLGFILVFKVSPSISRLFVITSGVINILLILTLRLILKKIAETGRVLSELKQRVLFVGWNGQAERIEQSVTSSRLSAYTIVGCICIDGLHVKSSEVPQRLKIGGYSDLESVLRYELIDIVILVETKGVSDMVVEVANLCEKMMLTFKVIPTYFDSLVSSLNLEQIGAVSILGRSELPLERLGNRIIKRVVDLVGGFVGVAISIPVIAIFGSLIFFESPGSIFFMQERLGRGGKRFMMFKLRSMKIGSERLDNLNQSTLRGDDRLLKIGAFIRRWNIDELPQFWNVLKGDMSLVGPRPERTFHASKLSNLIPHYNSRLMSKPGMTGWAQVNGFRGDTDLTERIRHDLYYLEKWSVGFDVQIMVQTLTSWKNAY